MNRRAESVSSGQTAPGNGWRVTQLTTDWDAEPITVRPGSNPRLSWIPQTSRSNAHQTSYRLVVRAGGAIVWDTGLVDGSDNVVHYAGAALIPSTSYTWTVEVVDDAGAHASSVARFDTIVDEQTLREAVWIAADEDHEPAPLFRRDVHVSDQPARARLHLAGLGLHRCTVNGAEVTDAQLESGFTDYDHSVLFSSHDVTDLIQKGANTVCVELGRGFYSLSTENTWRWHAAPWHAQRKLWMRLDIVDAEGRIETVSTDSSWTWADGPTRFDSLYEGETFDARVEPPGWDGLDVDPSHWHPVCVTIPPRGQLVPRSHEPVRITRETSPVSWRQVTPDTFVVDAGRTTAGWARITNRALVRGSTLTLIYGEQLNAEGRVHAYNRHVLSSDRFQVDRIVMGNETTCWQSRFTYKGFRYIEVQGITNADDIDLVVCDVHTDVASTSSFTCSDPVLTWIDQAMRTSILNNLHHLPTDTPMMEKNGWTGDAHVAAESMLGEFHLRRLLGKWLDDMSDSQELTSTGPRSPDGVVHEGRLPVIVPSPGWGYVELAPSPEWTTVYPFLLHRMVCWYDDPALASRHLDRVLRYLDYEIARLDTEDLSTGSLGDWLAPGPKAKPDDDLRIAASCYLFRALNLTLELGDSLPADIVPHNWAARRGRLTDAATRVRAAINHTFLDVESGVYRSEREPEYRQTSNLLPVAMGITPDDRIGAVVDNLVADVHAQDDHHNAGCLGLSQLLRVLTAHGHADLAITVATQTTPPGWGVWQQAGENTMLEMWRTSSRSHDHYFMGTPAQWLYESVAGVTMLEPGWTAFAVDPIARCGLDHATYTLQTVRGELATSWTQTDSALQLEVSVPVGARARIHLPDRQTVWVGSGHWSFGSEL